MKRIIDTSNNIVFFGGAEVSTESGIPDFRSENGIKKLLKNMETLQNQYFLTNTFSIILNNFTNIIKKILFILMQNLIMLTLELVNLKRKIR